MIKELKVKTDLYGKFKDIKTLNVPIVPIKNLDLKAKLVMPIDTSVQGSIDIDATDGSPSNEPKSFDFHGGEDWFSVGRFNISFGGQSYKVQLSGITSPPKQNTELTFNITW